MADYHSNLYERFELPVSTVQPKSVVRSRLARKLDEFENLMLTPEDDGFLRLAREVVEFSGEQDLSIELAPQSRPCAGLDGSDDGLIS